MLAQTVQGKAHFDVEIASGATTSGAFPTYGYRFLAVETPALFNGTAVSLVSAYLREGTYKAVGNASGAASAPAGPSQIVILGEVLVAPFSKVVSNAAEGAARTLRIHLMS